MDERGSRKMWETPVVERFGNFADLTEQGGCIPSNPGKEPSCGDCLADEGPPGQLGRCSTP